MNVRETADIQEIKSVLCHPVIYPCISQDGNPEPSEFEPPMTAKYIGGYLDGKIIGIMIYHPHKDGLKCHIQVLPEFRKEYSKEFGRIALNFGEAKNAIIYADIPTCYPNVLSFAQGLGFEETGSIKDDYVRDGQYYDAITMRLNHVVRQRYI
jgi:hypothetical protein